MPNGRKQKSAQRGSRNSSGPANKRDGPLGLRRLVGMGMAESSALDHVIPSDFTMRPPSGCFKATIPRNITNQIVWTRSVLQSVVNSSTSAAVEQNFAPSISANLPGYATWCAIFDQYYLHSFTMSISSDSPPGSTGTCPMVYTGIDFDSSSNIGVSALSAYASVNLAVLGPGNSVTRVVQPCNSTYLAAVAASGVTRTWVDCSVTSILFYGARSIIQQTSVAVVPCTYTITCNWCFRNVV